MHHIIFGLLYWLPVCHRLVQKIKKLGDILNGKDGDDAKSENDNAKPEEVGRSNQYHNGAGTM